MSVSANNPVATSSEVGGGSSTGSPQVDFPSLAEIAASLCVAQGAPMDIVGFIASTVGAEAVATVGHWISTQRVALYRHIETLLK